MFEIRLRGTIFLYYCIFFILFDFDTKVNFGIYVKVIKNSGSFIDQNYCESENIKKTFTQIRFVTFFTGFIKYAFYKD
jgi:hypothetical protein